MEGAYASLPTLNLQQLRDGNEAEQVRLFAACKAAGVFYLSYEGSDELTPLAAVDGMLRGGHEFFDLPIEQKSAVSWARTGTYFGYKPLGGAVVDQDGNPDSNEFLNIAKDEAIQQGCAAYQAHGLVDAEAATNAQYFVLQSHQTLLTILDNLSSILKVPTYDSLILKHRMDRPSGDHLRLVRYNPPRQTSKAQKVLLIPHTDFGTLTIIFTDRMGLQIFEPSVRRWQYVEPKPGLAIVNVGDALVKFTNGLLHSCLHRVVAPKSSNDENSTVKYSLGYFLRPEDDVQLRTVPSPLIPQPLEPEVAITGKEWTDFRANASKAENFQTTKDWSSVQGTAHKWQEAT